MTRDELAHRVLDMVTAIAPDVDATTVIPDIDYRDQFDFDSMDTLNFAIALHRELGIEVPEADYARLASLDKCVAYLTERLRAQRPSCSRRRATVCAAWGPLLSDRSVRRIARAFREPMGSLRGEHVVDPV